MQRQSAAGHCPIYGDWDLRFEPGNIDPDGKGGFVWNGVDVTDWPVWWQCSEGLCRHGWQDSLAHRVAGAGCPVCTG